MHTFVLPLDPVPCARPKMSRSGKVYYPKTYATWKAAAARMVTALVAERGLLKPLLGPLLVSLQILSRRPKTTKLDYPAPDVDNYAKAILDAGNGLIWKDDTQVIALRAEKAWAEPGQPGCVVIDVGEY